MKQSLVHEFTTDIDGNPSGGTTRGTGLQIKWQDGPLGQGEDRRFPNGAFVETLIQVAYERLAFYQLSNFNCHQNAFAMDALKDAFFHLESRTKAREERGVEGTHEQ